MWQLPDLANKRIMVQRNNHRRTNQWQFFKVDCTPTALPAGGVRRLFIIMKQPVHISVTVYNLAKLTNYLFIFITSTLIQFAWFKLTNKTIAKIFLYFISGQIFILVTEHHTIHTILWIIFLHLLQVNTFLLYEMQK